MLLLQALIIFYAYASARSEASVVQAMRDYVPVNNPYSKSFHLWGAFMTLAFAASFLFHGWEMVALAILWYWIVFDLALNIITKGWDEYDYIGETSAIDKVLRKWFGEYGGDKKLGIASVFILILNLIA